MCSAVLGSALASHVTLLHTLNIGENYIDCRGAVSLASALRTNRTLTSLTIRDNGVADTGAAALGEALRVSTTLRVLDASSALLTHACTATRFDARTPSPCAAALDTVSAPNRPAAGRIRRAASSCAGNEITVHGAVGLAFGLEQAQAIAELNLGGNKLGDDGARVLAGALPSCKTLKSLSLWGAGRRTVFHLHPPPPPLPPHRLSENARSVARRKRHRR